MMKQTIICNLFLMAVIITQVSCGAKKQAEKKDVLSVETIAVKTAPVVWNNAASIITATGQVTTATETRYAFKIGGVVNHVYVNEGASFKRGQLLANLQLTEIDAQLSQATLAYEKAKRDFTRTSNLYKDSVATLEQWQNAQTGVAISSNAVDAVAFNKKYANIYAEADGFVTSKLVNDKEVVAAGAPVLLVNETSGTNNWILQVGVTDKEWAAIKIGQAANVTIDAFPGNSFNAVVFRKAQTAAANGGAFRVELTLDVNGRRPAIGMFGSGSIRTAAENNLPSIPYEALIEADGTSGFVFVPDGGTKVKRLPVKVQRFDNQRVYIQAGLENNPEVIVSNSAFLNEQSTIRIIK